MYNAKRSLKTGEVFPGWLDLDEKDTTPKVASGLIVREDDDGTWSITRPQDNSVDSNFVTKEAALRVAKLGNEGGTITIEERTGRKVRKLKIHAGMLARYGEDVVTVTGTDGNDVKVLTPSGNEFFVDITQLTNVKEAQDFGQEVPGDAVGDDMGGVAAGEWKDEGEVMEDLETTLEKLEEEAEEEESEEHGTLQESSVNVEIIDELLDGASEGKSINERIIDKLLAEESEEEGMQTGPPMERGVEVLPMPDNYSQQPKGAQKTAITMSWEKGDIPNRKTTPKDLKELLKRIGIPVKASKSVTAATLKFIPNPMDPKNETFVIETVADEEPRQMNREDVLRTLVSTPYNYDEGKATELVHRVQLPANKFMLELVENPEEPLEDIMLPPPAVERVSPAIAEAMISNNISRIRVAKLLELLKEADKEVVAFEAGAEVYVPSRDTTAVVIGQQGNMFKIQLPDGTFDWVTKAGLELPGQHEEEMQEEKITYNKPNTAAKPVPTCKKCGKPHWPFQKCNQGGSKDGKETKETGKEAEEAGTKTETTTGAAVTTAEVQKISPAMAAVMRKYGIDEIPTEELEEALGEGDVDREAIEETEERDVPELVFCGPKKAGKVRMTFDWNEFFTDVMPQLSTPQFQHAYETTLNAVPEITAAQEEHNLYQEELDSFRREASKRGLPNPEDMAYGIGDRVATIEDPDLPGIVVEYKVADKAVHYLLNFGDDEPLWYKEAEIEPMELSVGIPDEEAQKGLGGLGLDEVHYLGYQTPEGSTFTDTMGRKIVRDSGGMGYIYEDTGEVVPPEELAKLERVEARRKRAKLEPGMDDGISVTTDGDINSYTTPEGRRATKVTEGKWIYEDTGEPAPLPTRQAAKSEPTSDSLLTTTPWTDRTHKITDPENATQHKDFAQELNQKTGEGGLNSTAKTPPTCKKCGKPHWPFQKCEDAGKKPGPEKLQDASEKEAARGEGKGVGGPPQGDAGADVCIGPNGEEKPHTKGMPCTVQYGLDWRGKNVRPGEKAVEKKETDLLDKLLNTESDLKVGSLVRIAADFDPEDVELQTLRDLEIAGPVTGIDGENITVTYPEGDLLINEADIEVVSNFGREATIRKCTPSDRNKSKPAEDQVWCLYTKHKPERVLGRHPSREKALAQERAIKAHGSKVVVADPGRGQGLGQGGPPQGDRGAEVCVCPTDGKEYPKERGIPCNAKTCSDHKETRLVGKSKAEQIPPTPPMSKGKTSSAKQAIGEPPGTTVEPSPKTKPFVSPPGGMAGDRKKVKKPPLTEEEKRRAEETERKLRETKAIRQTTESLYSYVDVLLDRVQEGNITVAQAQKEMKEEADLWEWGKEQVKYAKERLQGKVASLGLPFDIERSPAPDYEFTGGGEIARKSVMLKYAIDGKTYALQSLDYIEKVPDRYGALTDLVNLVVAHNDDAYGTEWLSVMQDNGYLSGISWEELKGSVEEDKWGHRAPEGYSVGNKHTAAFHGKEVVLCYHDGNYKLYNTDYGCITPEGAKEKDIKAQLTSFGIPDEKVTSALKDAKTAEVVIKLGALFNEKELRESFRKRVAPSIDIAVTTALTQWGPQATRAQLMMTAMDEFAKLEGGAEYARIAQDYIKDKLDAELSQYPREEYDGKREIPQSGMTGSKKEARTYTPEEKSKVVNEFKKHFIPLDDNIPKKAAPWREEETDYARNLNAIAFKIGDRVQDVAMPEIVGTVSSFEGENLVHVAVDASKFLPEGADGLYMVTGLLKLSQEPEFEDAEKSEQSSEEDVEDLDIWDQPKKEEVSVSF